MKNFIEELKWRGLIHDVMPGTEERLNKEMTSGYVGFDPTAASLTIGNLVSIMLLVHFQQAGHKPVALIGGATGMIGDPSGKAEERKLLSEETLRHNQESIKKQLSKFLDFSPAKTNQAELVNNYDWFKDFSFIDFLRDVGKHLTVNYMMAKDSVKSRLETGISFTEFSYQLLQGYDFLHLYKEKNCRLQMGGSDQWGNITAGTTLIKKMEGGEAFALTSPLITKADGTKMGKSEKGNIWLDPEMTSPYAFYQFWLKASDDDAAKWIKIFTLLGKEDIDSLIQEHQKDPGLWVLQKALAKDITVRVHSEKDYLGAVKTSEILFGKSSTLEELKSIKEDVFLSLDGILQVDLNKEEYQNAPNVTDLLSILTQSKIFTSKGEAKRLISGGGVSINKSKIQSADQKVDFDLIHKKYLLVQKGKKEYFLVKVI